MAEKFCAICGKKITLIMSRYKIVDGSICNDCFYNAGYTLVSTPIKTFTSDQIRSDIADNQAALKYLKPTHVIESLVSFNDTDKIWFVGTLADKKVPKVYRYSDIINVEIIEDIFYYEKLKKIYINSSSLAQNDPLKNLHGATGSHYIFLSEKIQVKITLNNMKSPTVFIEIPNLFLPELGSPKYQKKREKADNILAAFNLIKPKEASTTTPAQEPVQAAPAAENPKPTGGKTLPTEALKELKELLDFEIITQEEFDAKKKELLGL